MRSTNVILVIQFGNLNLETFYQISFKKKNSQGIISHPKVIRHCSYLVLLQRLYLQS